jgi:hypothetical protein
LITRAVVCGTSTAVNRFNMKIIKTCLLLLLCAPYAQAQEGYSAIGGGYSLANVSQSGFATFLFKVNEANAGLTKKFTTEDQFQGFNLFADFRSGKRQFSLGFSRISNHYKGEGLIPVVSSNAGSYDITSRHNIFSMQLDYFPVKFIGIGVEAGYSYSFFKNQQTDLFFGENNAVVDKKGGLHVGANIILQIPLGQHAFLQIQPYYLRALYQNDMDNVAVIYLGANNTAAAKTELSSLGANLKLGIKI